MCTYCQVVDSHAAQGPAVVAEVVLNGGISHLEKRRYRIRHSHFHYACCNGKLDQLWISGESSKTCYRYNRVM